MKKFLQEVATALWSEYGEQISEQRIIFTGKRARLFFNEALLEAAGDRPLWQPHYMTIDEVVHSLSTLQQVEHVRLISELYKIYNRYHPESFDRFYRWGEMLLSDFDTIDKYLINAGALYSNISDLREVDAQFSNIFDGDDHSLELVRSFWTTMNARHTKSVEQQYFSKIWQSLFNIYTLYKEHLRSLGIGYSGMIYRDVAESMTHSDELDTRLTGKNFNFVGFNALNECEKRIFDDLNSHGLARFYWDYDNYFLDDTAQEAGRFIRRNIARFGDSGTAFATTIADPSTPLNNPDAKDLFEHRNFVKPKQVEVVSTPSDVLQCKMLYYELERIHKRQGFIDKETAIVLTDESLLSTLLHSIPPQVESLNITMGYPITATTPYILLDKLLQLHSMSRVVESDSGQTTEFGYQEVLALLNHPYLIEQCGRAATELVTTIENSQITSITPNFIAQFCDTHAELSEGGMTLLSVFRTIATGEQMQEYITELFSKFGAIVSDTPQQRERKEFIYIILEEIQKLTSTIRQSELGDLTRNIFGSLLRQSLASKRVAYQGEPLCGLQIMGILETRNLDFENVIVLSLTDENFPGNRATSSYIPFNLRQAFGLPTPADHEAMWGYYFYRLISRCNNLVLMYSSAADDRLTGEQSRYIYQLEYESPHKITYSNINLSIESKPRKVISIAKDQAIMQELDRLKLYPSKINRVIDCPLRFYFYDIERLKIKDSIQPQITHLDVGNTLHQAIETLYKPLIGLPLAPKHISRISDSQITDAVYQAMTTVLGQRVEQLESDGRMQLHRDIVTRYTRNIVRWDASSHEDFVITAIEEPIEYTFMSGSVLGDITLTKDVTIAGVADRIDTMSDGTIRVIDYKSGGDSTEYEDIPSLFTNTKFKKDDSPGYSAHNSALLQAMLYGLVTRLSQRAEVSVALYVARKMENSPLGESFCPYPQGRNEEPYNPIFGAVKISDTQIADLTKGLGALLANIADPKQEFCQTIHTESCKYCDYKTLCNIR